MARFEVVLILNILSLTSIYPGIHGTDPDNYQGCNWDDSINRLLSDLIFCPKTESVSAQCENACSRSQPYCQSSAMTIDMCRSICVNQNFRYYALQAGMQCFCGGNFAPFDSGGLALGCDYPCAGDPSQNCGGEYRMDVYEIANPIQGSNCFHPGYVATTKNVTRIGPNFRRGVVLSYMDVCPEGYLHQGPQALRCQPTGQWNGTTPTCAITCPEPPVPMFGEIRIGGPKDVYLSGDAFLFICTAEGGRADTSYYALRCSDGEWMGNGLNVICRDPSITTTQPPTTTRWITSTVPTTTKVTTTLATTTTPIATTPKSSTTAEKSTTSTATSTKLSSSSFTRTTPTTQILAETTLKSTLSTLERQTSVIQTTPTISTSSIQMSTTTARTSSLPMTTKQTPIPSSSRGQIPELSTLKLQTSTITTPTSETSSKSSSRPTETSSKSSSRPTETSSKSSSRQTETSSKFSSRPTETSSKSSSRPTETSSKFSSRPTETSSKSSSRPTETSSKSSSRPTDTSSKFSSRPTETSSKFSSRPTETSSKSSSRPTRPKQSTATPPLSTTVMPTTPAQTPTTTSARTKMKTTSRRTTVVETSSTPTTKPTDPRDSSTKIGLSTKNTTTEGTSSTPAPTSNTRGVTSSGVVAVTFPGMNNSETGTPNKTVTNPQGTMRTKTTTKPPREAQDSIKNLIPYLLAAGAMALFVIIMIFAAGVTFLRPRKKDEKRKPKNGHANGLANGHANGHVNGHANGHVNGRIISPPMSPHDFGGSGYKEGGAVLDNPVFVDDLSSFTGSLPRTGFSSPWQRDSTTYESLHETDTISLIKKNNKEQSTASGGPPPPPPPPPPLSSFTSNSGAPTLPRNRDKPPLATRRLPPLGEVPRGSYTLPKPPTVAPKPSVSKDGKGPAPPTPPPFLPSSSSTLPRRTSASDSTNSRVLGAEAPQVHVSQSDLYAAINKKPKLKRTHAVPLPIMPGDMNTIDSSYLSMSGFSTLGYDERRTSTLRSDASTLRSNASGEYFDDQTQQIATRL